MTAAIRVHWMSFAAHRNRDSADFAPTTLFRSCSGLKTNKEGRNVMNTLARWMLVSVMMTVIIAVAAPAFSAQATQIFSCEQDDDTSEADLRSQAKKWLKAARQMKGGAGLDVYLYFPIAVNLPKESDFFFVVVAPSFEQWGVFWDGYQGSPAAKVDSENDGIVCPDSAVWESEKVVLTAD